MAGPTEEMETGDEYDIQDGRFTNNAPHISNGEVQTNPASQQMQLSRIRKGDKGLQILTEQCEKELEKEKDRLHKEYQSKLQEAETHRKEAEQELKAVLNRNIDSLRKQNQQLQDCLNKAEEEKETLRKKVEDMNKKLQTLTQDKGILLAENRSFSEKDVRTQQELANEMGRRDHIEFSLKNAEANVRMFQEQLTKVQSENASLNGTIYQQGQQIEHKDALYRKTDSEKKCIQLHNERLLQQLNDMTGKFKRLEDQKNDLLSRLSKMAGEKLTVANPAIADLSDQYRPTKLAEMFAEIYDNEWTDAFEELSGSKEDNSKEAISKMLQILHNTYDICQYILTEYINCLRIAASTVRIGAPASFEYSVSATPADNADECSVCHEPGGRLDKMSGSSTQTKTPLESRVVGQSNEDSKISRKMTGRDKPSKWDASLSSGVDADLAKNTSTFYVDASTDDRCSPFKHSNITEKKITDKSRKLTKEELVLLTGIQNTTVLELSHDIENTVAEMVADQQKIDQKVHPSTLAFLHKCVYICWKMVLHDPRVFIDRTSTRKNPWELQEIYRAYTKSGETLQYPVWPALFQYEAGPLLTKGVAQFT